MSHNINRQRWVLVLTSIASFMVGLDVLVVTTALTTIRQQLGASLSELHRIALMHDGLADAACLPGNVIWIR